MRYTKRANKGFTLLEILLVIAAIGILAAIVLVAINPNRQIEAARQAKRRSDINTITKAIQQYIIDNRGEYPEGIETGAKAICQIGNTPTGCIDLSTFLVPDYLAAIPEADTNSYYIRKNTSGTSIEVTHPRDDIWNIGGTPSLDLNFARNKSLIDSISGNNLVTFTRASGGTYVGDDGLVKTATTNEPRFDHDPVTRESLGLLVEESRTNLLLRSEEFENAYWTKNGSSITANTIVAPDGTLSGDKLVEDTSNGPHAVARPIPFTSGLTYTASFYVKAAERTRVRIAAGNNNVWEASVNFDLESLSTIGTPLGTSTITPVGNGWIRISITGTAISTANTNVNLQLLQPTAVTSYTGDGSSGIYIWGAQLEAGAFATSYIPTTDSTVTRSADVASITDTNFTSWYNASEGTVFNDSKVIAPNVQTQATYSFTGGTYNISLRQPQGLGDRFRANIGNVFTPSPGTGAALSTGTTKAVIAYLNTTGRLQVGASFNEVTMGGVLDATQFNVGSLGSGTTPINGTIRRITYFPTRLSNTTLENITK